jgi:Protein of unknown function (DUF3108)
MKTRNTRRVGRLSLLLIIIAAAGSAAFAQKLALKPNIKPFEPGESLTYKAEVSKSLLKKLDVATLTFTVDAVDVANAQSSATADSTMTPSRIALKLTGDAASEGFFVKLAGVHFHQHVESTVDSESLAVQQTVKLDEQGKRVRSSEATFDQKGKVVWTERDLKDPTHPLRTASADFTGPMNDVVSAIYYLREQQLIVGRSFEVPISDSGRIYKVPVRVVEKKKIRTVLGRVSVVRVDPELLGERGMVNAKGQFSIWLTDDRRHIPVAAQLKSEWGTFDITLKKIAQGSQTKQAKSLAQK